jgi:bifunctional non-homologous end joining protein LigD
MTASLFGSHLPAPMLPSLADAPFDSTDWFFELKWDGVRAVCLVTREGVTAVSRTGHDLTRQFPELRDLRRAFVRLPVVVDGEIVSLDRKGLSSFQRLQPRINRTRTNDETPGIPVNFVVFDMLGRASSDMRDLPLERRKAILSEQLREGDRFVLLSKHVVGAGKALFTRARRLGVEGIVAKRRDSPYRSGRSRDWLKVKTAIRQEFVIVGWTEPRGSRQHIGALLLGLYSGKELTYAGHVGTGFDEATLAELYRRLAPLETKRCPLDVAPKTNSPVHWVRPRLVAEVKFGEWTRDGVLRQPVYIGLRIDKRPEDCVREEPAAHRRSKR